MVSLHDSILRSILIAYTASVFDVSLSETVIFKVVQFRVHLAFLKITVAFLFCLILIKLRDLST